MSGGPRVRFAPSPTGYFHVGSARTSLYNWLFARKMGGTFVLRIEDTDTERNRREWLDGICESMAWLGLNWDEGPYLQSERRPDHIAALQRLHSQGDAYYCDCVREEVDKRNEANGRKTPGYDGFCRDRGLEAGEGRALRFKVGAGDPVVVHDLIRGDVVFERDTLDDFVIAKPDGSPLFVLANTVDDISMRITHVIRGEDLLPSTPKGMLVYRALTDAEYPAFAHLPMLVNEKRQKLSKRRDPVAIEDYRSKGFLPEAMVNYLALLGWSPGNDREILPLAEMVTEFKIERVNHSPAFFDVAKLEHFNGEYIRALSVEDFLSRAEPYLREGYSEAQHYVGSFESGIVGFKQIAPLVQERVSKLSDAWPMADFLFVEDDSVAYDSAAWEKVMVNGKVAAAGMLSGAVELFELGDWDAEALKSATSSVGEKLGLKLGKAQAPLRVAITGKTVGPPLFEAMVALGRESVLSRLKSAQEKLGG